METDELNNAQHAGSVMSVENKPINPLGQTRQSQDYADSIIASGDYTQSVQQPAGKGNMQSVNSGGITAADSTTLAGPSMVSPRGEEKTGEITSIIEKEKEEDKESQHTEPKVNNDGSDNNKKSEGNDA